ncbi:ATP-binding protein [Rhizobium herbae]|uniref:Non-specific serine/threonine protein kinase n=1 Tax=Rhizobium herbae TaxID=508661 RepID=A0ABS4EWB9_9HYPH|nr:winged helix-turn-helix domain-containing protein [Rhizobium herbae]MBP1862250.1 non-specific serine/threonine protein kinase [Rhizobium herbae]
MGQIELRVFEFRGWEIDLARRELRALGSVVPIGSRAFEIIETLLDSPGELVTKDDLMKRVWPGLVVEDNTIQVHISAIRKVLGEDKNILKTIAGRGYRLLGDWTARPENFTEQPHLHEQAQSTAVAFRTNIPMAASPLVGRETAVEQLSELVSAYRVVTLTGPGGIGKTVLASEVGRRVFPTFQGDVLFIELVSLSDPDLVSSTVAHVLSLRIHGEKLSPELVARAIGGRRALLILDNCEHVIEAAAALTENIVHVCPDVCVLATSRELLRIDGEYAYPVPSLEVPAQDLEGSQDALEHSAVQLFVARTHSLRADFEPQDDKLPAIASICRQLDGIPLAIEFAAARAATLGIQQVAGRLDDRFALLTGGRRTALPRHQTLRATLDWSYDLLPETERRLLRHLSIFPAGFTIEAAAAVVDDLETSVALGISSLVSKSLVVLDGSEVARRWRLLESVRVYSLEKLADADEHGRAMRHLVEFCLILFSPFAPESEIDPPIDDLEEYRREIGNLRAALNWALSSGTDATLGVALAATASDFWVAVSLVAEAGEWAEKALGQIGDATGTRTEMVLRCSLGYALIYTQGMSPRARQMLTGGLALAHTFQDFDYQQRATCGLWLFSARSMALKDALAFAREYEEVARGRDLQSRSTAAWLVGIPQTYLASHAEANEQLQWAIDQYPCARRRRDMMRLGADVRTSAKAHNTVNLLSQGFLDTASRTAGRAIEEARETNQPFVVCVALAWAAGFVALSLGEFDKARSFGEELVHLAYKHGLRPFHAVGLCVKGSLAARGDNPEAGIAPLRAGLAEMQQATYLLFYPFFLTELAAALGAIGRVDESLEEIGKALRFAVETDYRWFVPEILRVEAELLVLRGSDDPALIESLLRQSMGQASAQQAVYWELSAAVSLAERLRRVQKHDEAVEVLAPVYDRLSEGFFAPRVKRAKTLLDELA